MAKTYRKNDKPLWLAAILAWLLPGAGHWYLGRSARGGIICGAICSTFLLGVILGGVEIIGPQGSKPWFCAQLLCGTPALIGSLIQNPNIQMGYGRGIDLGQVYTGIAGLLNLLCILDALVYSSKTMQPPKV